MADYVPSTTNVWPYYSANNKPNVMSGQDKTLGKDEFLKIMIAQIKNQDPMQPMEDKEFIAQMAQFTSVEQLTNMAKSMEQLSQSIGISSSLIGKTVSWQVEATNGNAPVIREGTVDSITVKDGTTFAVVGSEWITLGRILSVALTPTETPTDPPTEQQAEGVNGQ